MPRENDCPTPTDAAFDRLIEEMQMRDATPRPSVAFVRTLESTLVTPDRQMQGRPFLAPSAPRRRLPRWVAPTAATRVRWATFAATIALLVATVGGAYLSGIDVPGRVGREATGISAPVTGSPTAEPVAISASCEQDKAYLSGIQGQSYLHDSAFFGDESYAMDRLQLQRWALGPDASHAFASSRFKGVSGVVLDTVATGLYQATFDGPVIATTSYGDPFSQVFTRLDAETNQIELGPGESVLFEIGTRHTVSNPSSARTLSIERAYFYSGDATKLTPMGADASFETYGPYKADDSVGINQVGARISGSGTIAPDDVQPNWDRTAFVLEHVAIYPPGTTLGELVGPCGFPSPMKQLRDVAEITSRSARYTGYLVWIGEGGTG